MHDKFVVVVPVQAFKPRSIPAHAVHPGRGIAGKDEPLRIERMELGMNHGSLERDPMPTRTISSPDHDTAPRVLFDSRSQPLAATAERTLAKLCTREIDNLFLLQCAPVDAPDRGAAHKKYQLTIR